MRRAWLLLIGACWSGSSSSTQTPRPAEDDPVVVESTPPPDDPADPVASAPPRAPLDGRLRVQPQRMCGGAAPPHDYQPPPLAPVPGEKLLVTAGKRYTGAAPVAELATDKDGLFSATLPAGTYCLTRAGRGPKPTQVGQYSDLACLVRRWESCEGIAVVPVARRVMIDIYEPCQWSICYHGPPPP